MDRPGMMRSQGWISILAIHFPTNIIFPIKFHGGNMKRGQVLHILASEIRIYDKNMIKGWAAYYPDEMESSGFSLSPSPTHFKIRILRAFKKGRTNWVECRVAMDLGRTYGWPAIPMVNHRSFKCFMEADSLQNYTEEET